jgi:hypothetical protein
LRKIGTEPMENKKTRFNLKSVGLILMILSIGLLIREVLQYDNLPSKDDPISQVADFFKYKENAMTNGIIWTGLLVLGLIIYLIKRKK